MKAIKERVAKSHTNITHDMVIDRVLQNRGIGCAEDMDYKLSGLYRASEFKGMDDATKSIISHILAGSKILILGDYDCDGATASSIAYEGLAMCGAKNVSYLVPDRAIHGYGMTPSIVEEAAKLEPDLIITVDNGISSFEGALAVKKLPKPCQLIITDHHLPSDLGVPEADAIINPNQKGCEFPGKATAGCGVIFYVIAATAKKMADSGLFEKLGINKPDVRELLDLVALGTIADLVPLDKNNRILVRAGIDRINEGLARPGINALLGRSDKEIGKVVSQDLAFYVGPKVNAAGRLKDMAIGIRCLTATDDKMAGEYADQLHELNMMRREIEAEMMEDASNSIEDVESQDYGVCLYNENWHEGVVGILASRVKEKLNRPVICFTDTTEAKEAKIQLSAAKTEQERKQKHELLMNTEIKGSARSVSGVHLKHLLDAISKKYPEILSKFGGHAMAAGMSIKHKDFARFARLFDRLVRRKLTPEMVQGEVLVDMDGLPDGAMTIEMAQKIRDLGPWGQEFEEPMFSSTFEVESFKVLKDKHLKLKLRPLSSLESVDAISFNCVNGDLPEVPAEIKACFRLDINDFRGRRNLQLMINYLDLEGENIGIERGMAAEPKPIEIKGLASHEKSRGNRKTNKPEKKTEQLNEPEAKTKHQKSAHPGIALAQSAIF